MSRCVFLYLCICQVCDQKLLQRSRRSAARLWYHQVNQQTWFQTASVSSPSFLFLPAHINRLSSPFLNCNLLSFTSFCVFVSIFRHCSRETYNALTTWLSDARMLASQNIVIILCGNKKDLDADREVTFLEASRFAQENGEINCLWSSGLLNCFSLYKDFI